MTGYMRRPKTWAEKLADMNANFSNAVDAMIRRKDIPSLQTEIWTAVCQQHGVVDHDSNGCMKCTQEKEKAWAEYDKRMAATKKK